MAGTRKARVPMAEQIRLINEYRQSSMTDADWCRENDMERRPNKDMTDEQLAELAPLQIATFCGQQGQIRRTVYILTRKNRLHGRSEPL